MGLIKTEHLGLSVFLRTDENNTLVRDVLRAIAENESSSNMHIIDNAIYDLQKTKTTNVIWDSSQPAEQDVGDVWNEILRE